MKKIFIYIMAFIVFTYLGSQSLDLAIARQIENAPPYCLSFASIGAIFLESRLDAWVKINSTSQEEKIDALIKEVRVELSLPEKAGWEIEKNKNTRKYQWHQGNEVYEITWVESTSNQAFLLVSITSKDPSINLGKYERLLGRSGEYSWHYNYTYTGEIGAIFNNDSMEVMTDTVLRNMNAQAYETYQLGESRSTRATSAQLPGRMAYKNIQLALRRQEHLGKTKVWIGVPSLLGAY